MSAGTGDLSRLRYVCNSQSPPLPTAAMTTQFHLQCMPSGGVNSRVLLPRKGRRYPHRPSRQPLNVDRTADLLVLVDDGLTSACVSRSPAFARLHHLGAGPSLCFVNSAGDPSRSRVWALTRELQCSPERWTTIAGAFLRKRFEGWRWAPRQDGK
jgi:hypothetical protein